MSFHPMNRGHLGENFDGRVSEVLVSWATKGAWAAKKKEKKSDKDNKSLEN